MLYQNIFFALTLEIGHIVPGIPAVFRILFIDAYLGYSLVKLEKSTE